MLWASTVLVLAVVWVRNVSGAMASLSELAEMVTNLQGQQAAMAQEVQRLSTENQILRQAAAQPHGGWRRSRKLSVKQFRPRWLRQHRLVRPAQGGRV